MPKLFVTNREGDAREVQAQASRTLMEVLRDEGFEIEALCGGCCSCATCHVYIDTDFADKLPARSEDEEILLEESPHFKPESSRLSCQIRVVEEMDGLALSIAPAD